MLDTYREVVTPEGVPLHLPAAGPVPRALAWSIDLMVRFGLLSVLGMVLALLGKTGEGLYLIGLFLLFWAYPIVLEAVWQGQTVGKKALGLRVVAADGAPVGWLAAITRNLLRTVDMLPFGYAASQPTGAPSAATTRRPSAFLPTVCPCHTASSTIG